MTAHLRNGNLIISILLISFIPLGSVASESEQEEEVESFERYGRNALGLFIGVTHEHGHNRETIGIEYAYRINRSWSVGALVERAERDQSSTLTNVFVHFWPTESLYLGAGYGRKDPGEERRNTIRATIGYEFEIGRGWFLEPQFHVDFIEEEETEEVLGIGFGIKF